MSEIVQGSDEWKQLRLGKVTASRVADMVARTKSGYGASRANYAAQLIAERLTGVPAESYVNAAMQHGTDTEPEARNAYEFYHGVSVREVAFVPHPTIPDAGCSPDGLVGDDGMVEIKAPNTSTHIETLLSQAIPPKYIPQMQFQMACCERQWVDFVSYDNRMPEHMRLFVKRLHRDDAKIKELEAEAVSFLIEIDKTLTELDGLYGQQEAA
jgi:putative phage-type endonuclease